MIIPGAVPIWSSLFFDDKRIAIRRKKIHGSADRKAGTPTFFDDTRIAIRLRRTRGSAGCKAGTPTFFIAFV